MLKSYFLTRGYLVKMELEFTKLSSKGQIVIPQGVRKEMHLKDGTLFVVATSEDTICLKRVEMPKIKKWNEAVKPFREAARKASFTQEDLANLITESKIKR